MFRRVHRGLRPWHVIQAKSGTREIPAIPLVRGVRRYNRKTGRKPECCWEVGCLHSSDEIG